MDKKEIIEVLQKMLDKYTSATQFGDYYGLMQHCRNLSIQLGFCYFLDIKLWGAQSRFDVLRELRTDSEKQSACEERYWYHTALGFFEKNLDVLNEDYFSADDVITLAIKPRISNIERTITRLQTELQTQN